MKKRIEKGKGKKGLHSHVNKYEKYSKIGETLKFIAEDRACTDKRFYRTKEEGEVNLAYTQRVYKCSFCFGFHRCSKVSRKIELIKRNKKK